MSVSIKGTPVLVRPNGSHWLEMNKNSGPEVFGKEELHPIIELDVPRVGKARAQFSVDRYAHSSGWSEWRIYLRAVRTPDPENPEATHLGRDAENVGPATREAITAACRPIIEAWLESAAYAIQRQHAATNAMRREVDAPADYAISRARTTLAKLAEELYPDTVDTITAALDKLAEARSILDSLDA